MKRKPVTPALPAAPPQTRRGRMLAALACVLVALAAYSLYWLNSLPVAKPTAVSERYQAGAGKVLKISGLAPGPLMSLTVRTQGMIKMSFAHGAVLVAPSADRLARLVPADDKIALPGGNWDGLIEISKQKTETASVDIELLPLTTPTGKAGASVYFEATEIAPGSPGFRLWADNARLKVVTALVGDPASARRGSMIIALPGKAVEGEIADFEMPERVKAGIAFPKADTGQNALVIELGNVEDPLNRSFLDAAAIASGHLESGGNFVAESVACGASHAGALLWWRLFPEIEDRGCADASLKLSGFQPNQSVSFAAEGVAFHRRDGKDDGWGVIASLMDNAIVKAIFSAAVAAFLGWAWVAVRNWRKASP